MEDRRFELLETREVYGIRVYPPIDAEDYVKKIMRIKRRAADGQEAIPAAYHEMDEHTLLVCEKEFFPAKEGFVDYAGEVALQIGSELISKEVEKVKHF